MEFDTSELLGPEVEGQYDDENVGNWQGFNVVVNIAAGQSASPVPTLQFPVRSALYKISGEAYHQSPDAMGAVVTTGGLDAFTIQVQLFDQQYLNAGQQALIASAFFDRQTGIKRYRKPWVIGANDPMSIFLTNISSDDITVALEFTALLLNQPTDSVVIG
jgi:hypothetical protein